MKITSVAHYPRPRYPEKEAVLLHPELLKKLPKRWQAKAAAFTALSACIPMLLTGSDKQPTETKMLDNLTPQEYVLTGLIALTYTLTEEEACTIILDEAGKYGLYFEQKNYPLSHVQLPSGLIKDDFGYAEDFETKEGTLYLDGFNLGDQIGYEYISKKDLQEFLPQGQVSTYGSYSISKKHRQNAIQQSEDFGGIYYFEDYRDTLQKGIKNKETGENVGIFYYTDAFSSLQAEEDLRAQVREFVQWLQEQPLI